MAKVVWVGEPPTRCDICGKRIKNIFIDGKTRMGPWAFMCPECHRRFGVGLGVGRGQKYVKNGEEWVKKEG